MKSAIFKKIVVGVAAASLCVVGLSACAGDAEEETPEGLTTETGLTGGVAATVNGTEIEEDKITRYINNVRIRGNYEEDDAWKEYLKGQNDTVESLRMDTIDTFVDQELVLQCAEQRGATATDEEIQGYVDEMRANYSSDEAWQTALEGAGFEDEDGYREALRFSILNKKLDESFEAEAEPDEAALLEQVQNSIATYAGAKKSSHILFSKEDKETAEQVLEQVRSGELDFAEAAKEYSTDSGSGEDGGNVGWDKLTTFVEEYQGALDNMSTGDISDLVESEYGYHIIKVTDEFNPPETLTSTSEVPEEILESIKSSLVSSNSSTAREDWLKSVRESCNVVINKMPDGLPYWVDMSTEYTQEEMDQINKDANVEVAEDIAETEEAVESVEAEGEEGTADGGDGASGAGENADGDAADGDAADGDAEGGSSDGSASE